MYITLTNEQLNLADSFERWQQAKYGNVIAPIDATPEPELYESGMQELERLTEWVEKTAEVEMIKEESNH